MDKSVLLNVLDGIAPLSLAEDWDNSGMQIDCGGKEVSRILIALEITNRVIDEAVREHCDFIVCHHPLLFVPVRRIAPDFTVGNHILRLIKEGISVYASHTCFDKAPGGNNDYLMKELGCSFPEDLAGGIARIGRLDKPVSFDEFISEVNAACGYEGLKIQGESDREIRTFAVCTGAGGEYLYDAYRQGVDAYVSGDVKHHDAQAARDLGICLIDAGHYGTEWQFVPNMASQLRADGRITAEIVRSESMRNPFDYTL
ncbi:MAG: Nif3-like dinuclear metal center hexameric protein [Clostridia bacterium]|nr:Nif3-like dinuclear metal center hexameric protein [Clostridia bacterium]